MSIRRVAEPLPRNPRPPAPTSVAIGAPQTIAGRLGIEEPHAPERWPAAFHPKFKEVPVVSGTVVDDVFDEMGVHVDPTGGVLGDLAKGAGNLAKGAGGALSAAKKKADAAVLRANAAKDAASQLVRKKAAEAAQTTAGRRLASGGRMAAAGAKKVATSVKNKNAGMHKFDYEVIDNANITAVLAVAKKADGGKELDEKNSISAFKDSKLDQVKKHAEMQKAKMTRTELLVKDKKKKKSTEATRAVPGRNAAILGFSKVEQSDESGETFGDAIFNADDPAGAGKVTIAQMGEFDTNSVAEMVPITALVIEAMDVDDIARIDPASEGKEERIQVKMQAIPEANIDVEVVNKLTTSQVDFEYTLCVHGLHVTADVAGQKSLMAGRKILVNQNKPGDIRAYGISMPTGIESALHHAMEGTEIDLLYLWACYRFVQGVYNLGKMTNLDMAEKTSIKKLLAEGLGTAKQHNFSEDFEDEEFDEVNSLQMPMQNWH